MMTSKIGKNTFTAPFPGHPCRRRLLLLLLVLLTTPRADGLTAKYSISEEEPPGTVVGNLAADLQLEAAGSFRLMQKSNWSLVEVGENDGQLTVGGRIDREQLCRQQSGAEPCLLLFDVVNLSGDKFVLIRVELRVRDINDHAPVFGRSELRVEISESSAPGTRVPLEAALDADVGANSLQQYRLSPSRPFALELRSGADGLAHAELVLVEALDRESQAEFVLQLEAADGGDPPRTGAARLRVQVLDSNDNSPAFQRSSFTVELREDAPPGSSLLQLEAADPDLGLNGEVVYSFSPQLPAPIRRLFSLDAQTGWLSLAGPLDRESRASFRLEVRAHDRGVPPSAATGCTVTVRVLDVNDNAPEIGIAPLAPGGGGSLAHISEAAAPGSLVALVSTSDRDSGANGRVSCSLSGHEHFELRPAYGSSHMVVTAAPLDRERAAQYNLTLLAEDLGADPRRTVRTLTVRLTDENDNAPAFSRRLYRVSVLENNQAGTYLTTVVARDPDLADNGRVTYRLLGPGSALASVDPATGAIYALRSFDRESLPEAQLLLQATDGGSPPLSSSATVLLTVADRNDNAPVITHPPPGNGSCCVITLPRDGGAGYLATRVRARDADEGANAKLSFRLLSGSQAGLFTIDSGTGEIKLGRRPLGLGPEALRLVVAVSDSGWPALSATATLQLVVAAAEAAGGNAPLRPEKRSWDTSLVVIVVLAGGCAALLMAIVLIATACGRVSKPVEWEEAQLPKGRFAVRIGASGDGRYDGTTAPELAGGGVKVFPTVGSHTTTKPQHFSPTSGFGQTLHPVAIWQGKQFAFSKSELANQTQDRFSGKDSGKGDSDFNDSDSDISGIGLSKSNAPSQKQNGLPSCTSECKLLGHSDRCWSPSSQGPKSYSSTGTAEHLNTFGKSTSVPREHLRKDTYYQALLPKTAGLQSVYQKVTCNESETVTSVIVPQFHTVGLNSHSSRLIPH
ncbi:protocadherin-8-like isoform X2 [Mobula hypostoma]|uniref:protocadherin-8-like isoform X2 n=1 Tax=Mobula hypostoma TaxID=723540 RepID=UPI002FC28045